MNLTSAELPRHIAVLSVQGSFDGATYGQILVEGEQLVTRGARVLILDLTECEYMSSAGLMTLTLLWKRMRALQRAENDAAWETQNVLARAGVLGYRRQLILAGARPDVLRVLNLAGMPAYIEMYPDVPTALVALES